MHISRINNSVNFQHKIFVDIGASNPKGSLKIISVSDDNGQIISQKRGTNSYVNTDVRGFDNSQDFIDKVAHHIHRAEEKVRLKDLCGTFPLSEQDKKLSGIVIFVPGTTYTKDGKPNFISFMPNIRDKNNIALKDLDFSDYERQLKELPQEETGMPIDKDNFSVVVTKDLGGTGVALAEMLAKKDMLHEGDYIMGVMTGGGFGSVDLKVKNKNVEIETSESSSYIAGNYAAYDSIAEIIRMTASANDPTSALDFLRMDNNKWLKENIQVLGKLGRQGVNVKSYIGSFCTELGRKDLFPLLQAVGDARIVQINRMCVSDTDTELLEELRSMPNEFIEKESTTDGKIAFEMNEDFFGKENLKRASVAAANDYANSISLISINKIADFINKVVLMGPFAHGVNQYVKNHSEDFDGAKDLPELIMRKINTNIDEKHADLPSIKELMKLHNFEIICDRDLNIADNTQAGSVFFNPKFKFVENRGNWFSIPVSALKKG